MKKILFFIFLTSSVVAQERVIIFPQHAPSINGAVRVDSISSYPVFYHNGWKAFIDSAITAYAGILSSQNIIYVTANAKNSHNQFTTIGQAISEWTPGKTILLAPESFYEDVIIPRADSGLVMRGLSNASTRIKGTFVDSAKDVHVADIRFDSTFSLLCPDTFSTSSVNRFENLVFAGDLYVGGKWSPQNYGAVFSGCRFVKSDQVVLLNQAVGWQNILHFFNCSTFYWTADSSYRGINVKVYGGYNSFKSCPLILIDTLYYNCNLTGGEIEAIGCGVFDVYGNIVIDSNTVNYSVFAVTDGYVAGRNTWTFNNKAEIDLLHVEFGMPNVVFNSSGNSRIEFCNQRGYNSPSTISGTGLNKLYIKNSIFHFDAPAGLAEDMGNSWKSFIDD